MVKRYLVLFGAAVALMLATPVLASAQGTDAYPAPPVSSAIQVTGSTISVAATSHSVVETTHSVVPVAAGGGSAGALAYTGLGLNLGLAITVAVLVLAAGVVLTLTGARRSFKRTGSRHS